MARSKIFSSLGLPDQGDLADYIHSSVPRFDANSLSYDGPSVRLGAAAVKPPDPWSPVRSPQRDIEYDGLFNTMRGAPQGPYGVERDLPPPYRPLFDPSPAPRPLAPSPYGPGIDSPPPGGYGQYAPLPAPSPYGPGIDSPSAGYGPPSRPPITQSVVDPERHPPMEMPGNDRQGPPPFDGEVPGSRQPGRASSDTPPPGFVWESVITPNGRQGWRLAADTAASSDGQTLGTQSAQTQRDFRSTYGDQADAAWTQQHLSELQANRRNYGSWEPAPGARPSPGHGSDGPFPDRRIGAGQQGPPPFDGEVPGSRQSDPNAQLNSVGAVLTDLVKSGKITPETADGLWREAVAEHQRRLQRPAAPGAAPPLAQPPQSGLPQSVAEAEAMNAAGGSANRTPAAAAAQTAATNAQIAAGQPQAQQDIEAIKADLRQRLGIPPPAGAPAATTQSAGATVPQSARSTGAAETLGPIAQGDPKSFFETAGPYARQVERETGVPAALSLAIAANETGYGQTRYMAGKNNYHGIQDSTGTGTPYRDWRPGPNGEKIYYEARQSGFETPLEGFRGFANFLTSNPRYAPALARYQQTKDVNQLAADIHKAGYAEDPAYTTKIQSIIRGIPVQTGVGEVTDTRAVPLSTANAQPPASDPSVQQAAAGVPMSATGVNPAAARTPGINLTDVLQRYEGGKYTFGGGRDGQGYGVPGSKTTDCSSFVSAVMKEQGVELPAHTDLAYRKLQQVGAQRVSPDQAQPGDIIFYMGSGYGGTLSYHMGIFAGPGRILDMSTSGGTNGVAIRPITHAGSDIQIFRDPRLGAR